MWLDIVFGFDGELSWRVVVKEERVDYCHK